MQKCELMFSRSATGKKYQGHVNVPYNIYISPFVMRDEIKYPNNYLYHRD